MVQPTRARPLSGNQSDCNKKTPSSHDRVRVVRNGVVRFAPCYTLCHFHRSTPSRGNTQSAIGRLSRLCLLGRGDFISDASTTSAFRTVPTDCVFRNELGPNDPSTPNSAFQSAGANVRHSISTFNSQLGFQISRVQTFGFELGFSSNEHRFSGSELRDRRPSFRDQMESPISYAFSPRGGVATCCCFCPFWFLCSTTKWHCV